ncbi:MAG: exosortase/archaeosortase family protein, partial [Alphaproteobacteria bacterium]
MAGPLAIAVGTALLLLGGRAWRDGLAAAGDDHRWGRRDSALLVLQVALFLLSLAAASVLFGDATSSGGHLGAWALAWGALLAATVAAWVPLVVHPRALTATLRTSAGLLAACAATGALAWWAGSTTASLWLPMRDATVALVGAILPRSGLEVGEDEAGVTLALGDFAVIVGPTCSGYEGIGLMTVFVAAFLAWFRDRLRFPAAFLLLPLGVVAAWLGNGLRLAALLEIGAHVSPAIAMGGFHAYSGSLLFSAIALGLAAFAERSPFFSTRADDGEPAAASTGDAADWLLPWLAMLATSMLTGAASRGGADPLYALRLVAAVAVLAARRNRLRGLAVAPAPAAFGLGALAFAAWLAIAAFGAPDGGATSWPTGLPALLVRV